MAKKKKNRGNKNTEKNDFVDEVPDPSSSEFFYDEVDQFHMDQENILLSKGAQIRDRSQGMRKDEEVLGVASDSSDDDERIEMFESRLKKIRGSVSIDGLGSDLEEEEEEKPKKDDDGDSSGLEELDDDQLEEKEALKLQRELVGELDDDDFGLVALQKSHTEEGTEVEKVSRNVGNMKKSEKMKILQEESPELMMLIKELNDRMKWTKNMMVNVLIFSDIEKLEVRLNLDYCVTLNFYIYLKLKQEDITNHPVIERIRFYNEAFKNLNAGKSIKPVKTAFSIDSLMKTEDNAVNEEEEVEGEEDGRRGINKTIEKNRGLTPRRKKENKNPRVKHRKKFQKALIRRTGQVRPVRHEINPYQGEIAGIRSGIKKGIKFK